MKKQILATGLSGLVGTRIRELLEDSFEFTDLSLATGVNITDSESVEKSVGDSEARVILHMAAKTDVDACEDDQVLGEEGAAWMVNVGGTENIVTAAKKTGKRVIYISTDFVFDGTKEFYTEKDSPNPVNWYARTKYEGEKLVAAADINSTIVRIAYPYRSSFSEKKDFVRRIKEKMEKGEEVKAVTDHIFTPTFIDDIASALKLLLATDFPGIYHVVGSQSLSTLEAANLIAQMFSLKARITPVVRSEYFKGKAFRPFKLRLKNDKIAKLGVKMRRFDEGLEEVKKQLTKQDN
ncbi:NAD(P)-dependent oxidoreductase [Candidatus Microgenomates bacterium]|nr:NAD(P)-dependent oxidoreductase [Candidatus Microgenomates bacterium]